VKRLLLLIPLCLIGCQQDGFYESSFLKFGTIVQLSLYAATAEQASQAAAITEAELARMHNNWHAWKPGPLTELNQQLASGQAVIIDHELLEMVERASDLSRQSSGLFNPAIGKLIAAWGFHQDGTAVSKPPADELVTNLLATKPSMHNLIITNNKIQTTNPSVQLDFGAFAKGYGLGLIARKLQSIGIQRFVLNAGGDLVAYGEHPQRPWRIAIRNPEGNTALAVIQARPGEAIFTSGDYERFYGSGEQQFHHIIDPRTGYPATGTRAVTVMHPDPALADAAATAIFIAGPNQWIKTAANLGVSLVLLVDSQDHIHMTHAMANRIEMTNTSNYTININKGNSK